MLVPRVGIRTSKVIILTPALESNLIASFFQRILPWSRPIQIWGTIFKPDLTDDLILSR